jgi:hypothetical protein
MDFIFPVFSSYVEFLPSPANIPARMAEVERIKGIVLSALRCYHNALARATQPG